MSITEAPPGHVLLTEGPIVGVESVRGRQAAGGISPKGVGEGPRDRSAELQMWRITEGRGALTLHLGGEFHVDRDLERLIGTLEPFVRERDEIRCVLVDASAMPQVPPSLLDTVRVLDRLARTFNTTVDIQPA
jgi:hypothetical protein